MKLLLILAVTLAISLAEDIEMDGESIDDLLAAASMDLQKSQYVAPSNYVPSRPWNPPSYSYNTAIPNIPPASPTPQPPSAPVSQSGYYQAQYDPPQSNYYPQNNWDNQNSWNNNQNQNTWTNPPNAWTQKPEVPANNQQNNWNNQNTGSQNTWNKPTNTDSQNTWNKPTNTGSENTWTKPTNTGSENTWTKPTNTGSQNWNNQNTNNWNNWNQTPSTTSTTTTPVSVIKNEHYLGENGSYKYEYEIADGTHVAEEGYMKNPNTETEALVKKGFYSFTGADGKIYSVTYWADETGFHAVGDHLPKPPPIPPAIQASIDQNAKEEAAKAEAEKNKQQQQQQGYYPQGQEPPKPIVPPQTSPPKPLPPTQPQYPQQTYYPQEQQQQTYYPPTNYYPPQAAYGRRR